MSIARTIFLSVLLAVASSVALAEEIKVEAGGGAPMENIFKPIKAPFEKATGLTLNAVPTGGKIALSDLEAGNIDAASLGLAFADWLELMKKEGAEVKDPSVFAPVVIGQDRIVVITNKENPVKSLSKDQLKGIFTGKIANWKEVGGKDAPIIVVWPKLAQGTTGTFVKKMLDGAPATTEVLEATTADDAKTNVAANAEAISVGPKAVVDATVNSPETPEVGRPITFVTKGKPSEKVQKLLDFINGEGQQYIKK